MNGRPDKVLCMSPAVRPSAQYLESGRIPYLDLCFDESRMRFPAFQKAGGLLLDSLYRFTGAWGEAIGDLLLTDARDVHD